MDKSDRTNASINVGQMGESVNALIDQVRNDGTRVLVKQNGVTVAAIISERDLRRLSEVEAQDAADYQALSRLAEHFKDAPDDEVEREVAAAIAKVRADQSRTHPARSS